ncbi:MAG: carbohydrate binding family 9 domain-containing protein [Lewinellaceae bacterium]|nr:carbohydrate binding family 9 domain-containing protein [Lewinellaceae bacterium]
MKVLFKIHTIFSFMLFIFGYHIAAFSQTKELVALRNHDHIKVDGILDEDGWLSADIATDFIQTEPSVGKPSDFRSEVKILYDNSAVYIGYNYFDPEPDKILKEFSLRDNPSSNADLCSVFFDPYSSGLHGFLFIVSSAGVQSDAIVSNQNEDFNWNAIWESAVKIHDKGWSAEIKIPFSAIRFPDKDIQEWGMNFGREIRRKREQCFWSFLDPTIAGWVQQSGKLKGISNISSPLRLSLTPYLSGYYNLDKLSDNTLVTNTAYNAGLDLKYGINDAFTLDMTVIPDFGQVISDKKVLNLSAYEVFFEENRQFFTEGTELFNKGNLFYSRRVGAQSSTTIDESQLASDEFITGYHTGNLINATKISGRTSNGTGLGLFNAISGAGYADIENADGEKRRIKTQPLTNYNVLVYDKNLKNNSSFYLMNTNVLRLGDFIDANVTGGGMNIRTKDQKYNTAFSGAYSNRQKKDFLEDGFKYDASWGKISGNWTYEFGHGIESVHYNPNDLGFLRSPNEFYGFGFLSYANYKPKSEKIQSYRVSLEAFHDRIYQPNVFSYMSFSVNSFLLLKSRVAFGLNGSINPWGEHDYFEPRIQDFKTFMAVPSNAKIGGFISSDYRKPVAIDANISYVYYQSTGRHNYFLSLFPRVRFNDRFSIFPSTQIALFNHDRGFVNKKLASTSLQNEIGEGILFGNRDRLRIENSISAQYIFTNKMGINLRIRHYWDNVQYLSFGTLNDDGTLKPIDFDGNDDSGAHAFNQNFNLFNVDFQFSWRFAPGSDMFLVWKNEIFKSDEEYLSSYSQNFGQLFDGGQSNSISLRVVYYLDYLYLFPKKSS